MKKILLLFFSLFSMSLFAQNNNTVYHFDYNFTNQIARLWIDFEILVEYDALENKILHKDYVFKDGYIFEGENDSLNEIGFYNDKTLVIDKQSYEMKNPAIGKIAIRKKGDSKWLPLKQSKETIVFTENVDDLPEVVKIWALTAVLQREISTREYQMYNRAKVSIGVGVGTSL